MQNLLKRRFFFRVGKHYGAKRCPIQVSCIRKDCGAKFLTQRFLHFRVVISQLARGVIRVKKFRGGNDLAQTIAKARLAR